MKIVAFLPLLSLLIDGAQAMGRKSDSSDSKDVSSNDDSDFFEGYWTGIDPNDGGDSRRTIIRHGGSYELVGRDSVLTLCGGTERGTLNAVNGGFMNGDLIFEGPLVCKNTDDGSAGATVDLIYTMTKLDDNLMMEHLFNAETNTEIYEAYFWRLASP